MQEKEKVLEIIGNVLDVYNGKEIKVVEKEVEPIVVETVVETKEETLKTEVKTEDKVVTEEKPKVDEPKVIESKVVEEKVIDVPVKVEETPQPTMAELIAKGITEALKPYQDEITTLKEANKGLSDNKAFGLQGRPTKVVEIDQDQFSVEAIYANSKK